MSAELEFELRLPEDFDESLWDSKGYFREAEFVFESKEYRLTFYDPIRLGQDTETEVQSTGFFFEENLVVVEKIDRKSLEAAVRWLIKTDQINRLVAAKT